MRGFYLLLFLALAVNISALGQSAGDFRSATSGPWNQASTWETFDGVATWNPAVAAPSGTANAINITAFTTVDVTTTVSAGQIVVEGDAVLNVQPNGGNLSIDAGGMTITEGDGFFTNDGFCFVLGGTTPGLMNLINTGAITSSLTNFQIDGTYTHARNGGIIPFASWNTGSLLLVTGVTNVAPTGFTGQSFYDLTWNSTHAASPPIILNGSLTSVARDFIVMNTGAGATTALSLTNLSNVPGTSFDPLTIGRDLIITGTGALAFAPSTGGIGYQVSIGRDLTISSVLAKTTPMNVAGANVTTGGSQVGISVAGNFTKAAIANNVSLTNTGSVNATCTATLDVNGNFSWGNGTLSMAAGSNASNFVIGQLNVGGDLTISAGTFTETSVSSNGRGQIFFDEAHVHNFTSPIGTPFPATATINFTIPSSNTVNIGASTSFSGLGGMLLNAGATLGIASVDGISQGTSLGNIRVSPTGRTYTVNANIIYNGVAAQVLGSEWDPSGGRLNGVAVNLEINNAAGVTNTISPSTNLVGSLTLTNGAFDIGTGNTFTIQGDFTATAGTITGHNNTSLAFTGSGTVTGNLNFTSGARILNNFTINRGASIFLGTDLTINQTGILSFPNSGNLRINGNTLTINGDITQSGSGAIATNSTASNLVIGGSGTLSALPLCTSCGFTNEFNNVTLDRGPGIAYNWNSAANINGTFALTSGDLTHSSGLIMATNSTFQRSAGTTFLLNPPNAVTTYNVSYIGNLLTSGELPTTTLNTLNDLTISGNVTLDKGIRINGNVSITSGTLDANTRNITMAGATFAVNGGTFTINSLNTVTFVRAGTTALSGSTISSSTFGGFTINSGTTVSAPSTNFNVAGVWSNNGSFTPNTGTVTFTGASQSIDAKGQPFFNVSFAGGTKTLLSALDANGWLEIQSTGILNGATFNINVADLWDNDGTFNKGTSTVVFDGAAQDIDAKGQPFFNLTLANSGTKTLLSTLDVDGALLINSGVSLDVTPTNYGVLVEGNLTNNGTFLPHTGAVTLNGSVTQFIAGTTNTQYYDIIQTNAATVTFSSPQSLINALTLQAGTFNPNGNFTVLSTASGDGYIAEITGGASIQATNMTVQRYLPNSNASQSYRYLSSPVTTGTVSSWKNNFVHGFPVTGTFNDPSTVAQWPAFPTMVQNSPSLFRYNEAKTPTTTLEDRYESFPLNGTSSTTALLENGRGYAGFVRQVAPITLDMIGVAATGQRNVNVTNTAAGVNDGWNLIGNPYPAPISWDKVTRPPGVAAQIAFKDNTNNIGLGTGQYVYFTQGSPGTGIPASYHGVVAQGQGFWIRATANATISFQEDDKEATSTPPFMRDADKDMLRIHVAGNSRQDELLIRFNEGALDVAENNFDAYKLKNDYINFSSLSSDGKEMAINTFGALTCSRQVSMVLKTVTPGPHALTFMEIESFSEGVDIRLLDNFTGQTFQVTPTTTNYNFQVTADPNSFGTNRFKVFVGYSDVDLSLNVQASDVCDGSNASIVVQAPESGVIYYATLNGTTVSDEVVATSASDVTLTVPNAKLSAGENTLVLLAKRAGCSAVPLLANAKVEIKSIPTVSSVTGDAICGAGILTLKAVGAPAGGGYKWYSAEDATDAIEGQTSSSFTTPSLTKTKTYFVSAINSLGCEGARKAVTASITYPFEIVSVTGAQACNGGTMNLSATGAPNDGTYRWYLDQASVEPIPNQSSASFVTPALSATTTYYVAAVNAAGCEGTRMAVTAEVVALGSATITVNGNELTSNFDSGNQWYLNGTAIPGATTKSIEPTTSGLYKLIVSSGACTTEIETNYAVTGDLSEEGVKGYMLYPNPSSGVLYVEVATTEPVVVSIKTQLGSEISNGELKMEGRVRKGQFDISGSANGVYLVIIKHGDKTVVRKIVKK